jgi:hypothetical protein
MPTVSIKAKPKPVSSDEAEYKKKRAAFLKQMAQMNQKPIDDLRKRTAASEANARKKQAQRAKELAKERALRVPVRKDR